MKNGNGKSHSHRNGNDRNRDNEGKFTSDQQTGNRQDSGYYRNDRNSDSDLIDWDQSERRNQRSDNQNSDYNSDRNDYSENENNWSNRDYNESDRSDRSDRTNRTSRRNNSDGGTYGQYGSGSLNRSGYGNGSSSSYGNGNYGTRNNVDYQNQMENESGGLSESRTWDEDDGIRREDHRGKGPKGYKRSDERIQEDVNDTLTHDRHIDASEIEVKVENGEVTLSGTVTERKAKRHAEDLTESISGVTNVQNNIRVSKNDKTESSSASTTESKHKTNGKH